MRKGALCLAFLAASASGQGAPDFGFMPDGGRGLFVTVFGSGPEAAAVLAESGDVAAWSDRIRLQGVEINEAQLRTLSGFLSINTPVPQAMESTEVAAILPPDGRDIALAECQSCHSLFTGYLMQRRDVTGWLAVFKSPFHRMIDMTEAERRTFADYSALNMPLKPDEVPAELRF